MEKSGYKASEISDCERYTHRHGGDWGEGICLEEREGEGKSQCPPSPQYETLHSRKPKISCSVCGCG